MFYLILRTDDNRAILPAHNSITFLSFGWHKALFARWPHWLFQTCYCLAHARSALHSLVGASLLGAVHISFYRFSTSTLQCYSQCVSRRLREKSVFFPECLTIRSVIHSSSVPRGIPAGLSCRKRDCEGKLRKRVRECKNRVSVVASIPLPATTARCRRELQCLDHSVCFSVSVFLRFSFTFIYPARRFRFRAQEQAGGGRRVAARMTSTMTILWIVAVAWTIIVATTVNAAGLKCDSVRPIFEAQGFPLSDIPKEAISC